MTASPGSVGAGARGEAWALHAAILDVGQADAIVLVSDDGEAMVVDAGHGTTAAQAIIDFLSEPARNGLQVIDEAKAMMKHSGEECASSTDCGKVAGSKM